MPISKKEKEFLLLSLNDIAVSINITQSNKKTIELLVESQQQSEELQTQQEELQTQQEELKTSNEELSERSEELKRQQEELQVTNE